MVGFRVHYVITGISRTAFESFLCGSVNDDAYEPLKPTPLKNL
jgi:hypothetical protein